MPVECHFCVELNTARCSILVLICVLWGAGEDSHVVMDTGKIPACASYQAYSDKFVQAGGQVPSLANLLFSNGAGTALDFPGVP